MLGDPSCRPGITDLAQGDSFGTVLRHGKFLLGANGLEVDPEKSAPTFAEWEAVGTMLATMERGQQFCVGDWLLHGEERFSEMAAQAIDARAWKEATCKAYRWLASRIGQADDTVSSTPTPRRTPNVAIKCS